MKSVPRLIRRFVAILLISGLLILVFNFLLMVMIGSYYSAGGSPWSEANDVAAALSQSENGYVLSDNMASRLKATGVWAILIDNASGKAVWHTDFLPAEIPLQYNLADIAILSRGYVKDYPTFTSGYNGGLVVLGFPKTSYWKALYNNWDLSFIANLPQTILFVILGNIALVFLIYMIANTKMLKSVSPILNGIEALPTERGVHVTVKGSLSEIAQYINKTSEILQTKEFKLKQKETARANWIAGVSHDIRTPLSVVMGCAGQLESDDGLPRPAREKAAVICAQSVHIKNLINDLNLASKLEYNMQPVLAESINAVSIVRQVVADFINSDIQNRYPVEWNTAESLTSCPIKGDAALVNRAVTNLLQNAQRHNPKGCTIFVEIKAFTNQCAICVEDNGKGVNDGHLEVIKNAPNYMACESHTPDQQHGLGLLIVRQIAAAHMGKAEFAHSKHGGFSASIFIPALE